MSAWPKHPDGRDKRLGEMTREEETAAMGQTVVKLQAELDDRGSTFRRSLEAIVTGPTVPRTRQ